MSWSHPADNSAAATASPMQSIVPKCRVCSEPFSADATCNHVPISSFSCSDSVCEDCIQSRLAQKLQSEPNGGGEVWIACPICQEERAFCQHKQLVNATLCESIQKFGQLQWTQSQRGGIDEVVEGVLDSRLPYAGNCADDNQDKNTKANDDVQKKLPKKPTTDKSKRKRPAAMRGQFEERLTELKAFKEEHGHVKVPHKYTPNLKLGYFCSNIRKFYRNKMNGQPTTLNDEQIKQLEELGFEFNINGPLTDFNDRIQGLKAFYEEHGHIRIPATRFVKPLTDKEPNPHWQLGSFVSDMRKEYKLYQLGQPSRLNTHRIKALEEVGIEWKAKHSQSFEEYVCECKAFYDKHGDFRFGKCNVDDSKSEKEANESLKHWATRVRAAYSKLQQEGKEYNDFLTSQRIKALNDIHFDWTNDSDHIWNTRYNELKEFKAKYGHCRPSQNRKGKTEGEAKTDMDVLVGWISKQREAYRSLIALHPELLQKNADSSSSLSWPNGKKRHMSLTPERVKALEDIGFEFVIRTSIPSFEERIQSLKKFKQEHGHLYLSTFRRDAEASNQHKSMARWLADIRLEYLKGKSSRLTPERMEALKELGIDWESEMREPADADKAANNESKTQTATNDKISTEAVVTEKNADRPAAAKVSKETSTAHGRQKKQRGRFDQLLLVAAKAKEKSSGGSTGTHEETKPVGKTRTSPRRSSHFARNEDAGKRKAGIQYEGQEERATKKTKKNVASRKSSHGRGLPPLKKKSKAKEPPPLIVQKSKVKS